MAIQAIQTLKVGSTGPAVLKWEQFLRGQELLVEREVDTKYTDATAEATRKFQKLHALGVDGEAGKNTITYAINQLKFEYETPLQDIPAKPSTIYPINAVDRPKFFGAIEFQPAPAAGNPEGIKITNAWSKDNLGKIVVPQLKGVQGAPASGEVFFHRKAIPQLQAMFKAWEDAGLKDLILTWSGSWAPRYIRGSRTILSNHSWATAFDINVAWNGLNCTPAAMGSKGSVRELVEIAVAHGFYWGGWFGVGSVAGGSKGRDGMHFEVYKIV